MLEGEFYNIEKILDRRMSKGNYEYKIKWEGYPMSQCTWEPMKNLETVKELVEEYNQLHPIATPKSTKSETKKKVKLINKKRKKEKDENDDKIKDSSQNENNINNIKEIDEAKLNINENINEKNYIIDDSLKSVITVKQENETLLAKVNKMDENGNISQIYIPTLELRIKNPSILIDFYESKIKFS